MKHFGIDFFFSLGIMPLRSIQVAMCIHSPLLFIAEQYFIVWIYQAPTEGHLGRAQSGAINCSSLTEGRLVLLQAADPLEILMGS